MSDHVTHLDASTFDETLANAPGPVLVDFWAAWCGPCRALGPTIDALGADHADDSVTVAKVDVDAAPELAARYGIASIPTVLVFNDGEVTERIVGLADRERLEAAITAGAT